METVISKNIVTALNDLIEINNDRIEGYNTAAKEVEDTDLKDLFQNLSSDSRKFKDELRPLLIKHDGKNIEHGTTTSGKMYRVWMDIKSALTGKDRKAILSSCEFGEDSALETYDKVLKDNELPSDVRNIVEKQRAQLKVSHDKIKSLRDSVK
jgi:uncharacterized protein (TIGR02284 family)